MRMMMRTDGHLLSRNESNDPRDKKRRKEFFRRIRGEEKFSSSLFTSFYVMTTIKSGATLHSHLFCSSKGPIIRSVLFISIGFSKK